MSALAELLHLGRASRSLAYENGRENAWTEEGDPGYPRDTEALAGRREQSCDCPSDGHHHVREHQIDPSSPCQHTWAGRRARNGHRLGHWGSQRPTVSWVNRCTIGREAQTWPALNEAAGGADEAATRCSMWAPLWEGDWVQPLGCSGLRLRGKTRPAPSAPYSACAQYSTFVLFCQASQ